MIIKDIKPGMHTKLRALIKKVTLGKNANTKKNYLNLELSDSTDILIAKYWNVEDKDISLYTLGSLVDVEGEVINYNGQRQLKVIKMRKIEANEKVKGDYVLKAPRELKDMENELKNVLDSIQDDSLHKITHEIIHSHYDKYITRTAAKSNHHDYYSGLLYHTLTMVKIADALCIIYPDIDRDLLVCGVLLHDIGKVDEFTSSIAPEYSTLGNLIGHITIASHYIQEAKMKLGIDNDKIILLEHLVLSHHGKLEYGSPVKPLIKEAELLTYIDNIDSKMAIFDKTYENMEEDNFSLRLFALDERQIYKKKKS